MSSNILKGQGCPICRESHLEKDVCFFLDRNNLNYIRQQRFDWLGMKSFGTGMNDFLNGVANWASTEGNIVKNSVH